MILLSYSQFLHAQTIVPAGLGPMSAVQPDRETAILSGNLLRTGGQNPTVKIVWGDEDGEIAGKSWDNTVVISTNQVVGSFSTTITIPNQEKIYYFRSVAENAGGTVVSRSLGVLNPSAVVGVSDLRGRWSFDDDNFSDPVSPADYSNLKLWLDAADSSTITKDGSNKVSLWNDKSGNSFNLSQSTSGSQPTYDPTNSKVTFSSDSLSATAPTLSQPLTFFTVLEYSGSNTNGQYVHDSSTGRYVFGEWSSDGWGLNQGDSSLKSTTLNPITKSVFSYQFNGSSSAVFINGNQELSGTHPTDNLGGNYVLGAHNGGSLAPFQGSIYEHLIISNISSQDRQNIEGYLARKWGIALSNSVNSIHAAKDSSGSNYHGILKKKFAPTNLSSTPKLWLDASELTSAGASWSDKSSNGNNAAKTGSPSIISNFQNGNTVMHYTGNGQRHTFNMINDIRTVFWIISQDVSVNGSGYRFVLSDTTKHPHWHNNNNGRFWGSHTASQVKGGVTRLNGNIINGETTSYPNSLAILSVQTTSNSDADCFGYDRSTTTNQWRGKLGEILIYNTALSDAEILNIEGYLAHKWGLMSNLPNSHPYKLAPPLGTGTPSFTADTPFGNGKAIDLLDGHVEISTGGNEDVFDGNGSFSVSAWVKGWSDDSFAPVISKGGEVPNPKSISSMKLWLDAQDLDTMDKGTSAGAIGTPTDGSNVKYWADKSGNGHHATASATPSYHTAGLWGKYPAVKNSGGYLTITNSATAFDAWDSMTMVYVHQWETGFWTWEENIKKGNGFIFGKSRSENHYNQGPRLATLDFRAGGAARANVEPKIVCFTYDGVAGKMNWHANGSSAGTKTSGVPSAFNSSSSDSVVFMNRMLYGEIFIFRNALSDTERQTIESHLAIKWGMTGNLPATHLFNTQKGWSVGRGENENTLITNIKGTGEIEEASHSTALSTDNQWHHIVSTYDGGTRKIYLDGTEVSSASASGSVASTTATLLLGASDMNDTAGTVAAARHSGIKLDEVRFYTSGLTSTQVSALYNFGKGDIGNIGEFTTLPAKISGTTGTALSTTVTAAFPNANYEAVNLTPGLGINSATGEISGTPTVGGVGSITVIAKNAAGKRAVTTIPYDSNPTGPAFAFPTTSPASDHAVVMGEITHSGGEENVVDLFWGDNDGNQTLSNWDSNATPLGTGKEGFYGTTISGLTAGETYHYRLRSQGKLNPKGISGSNLNLWLDAADSSTLTLYSGRVSTWSDKSGNDNHATQSNSDYQPTLNNSVLNALPVIRFDGSNDVMTLSGDHALQTFFFVLNARDGNNFGGWDWPMGGWTSSGNKKHVIFGRAGNNSIKGENASINGGTPSSEYINFSPLSEHKLVRVAFNAPASRSDWKIGDGDANWNGDFAEIIAYSGTLSTIQSQKVEGYLAHKWGLSLPNGHPYRITPPASQTTWSSVQSFTTPTNVTVPVLGSLSTANVKTTTADLQSTLTDNGNAATDLIFYWGDNDGGTNLSSWDSNFTVSNAQVGTLRKSLTGLTGGTTYYFRTYASNWKGNVWASTTRSFTTVTSTVRDNPVRNSDLKGWWKLDGNLKDSSGNNHHGKGDFTLSPKNFDGLKLWLDASDSSTISHNNNKVTLWKDKSGNNRHVSQSGADSIKPTLSSGSIAFNGSQYLFNDSPFMYANGSIEIFIVASGNSQSDKRFICEGSSSDSDPIYAFQTTNESPQNRLAVYFRNDTGSARRSQNAILNDVAMDGSYKILHWMDTGSSSVWSRVRWWRSGIS